jgi:hypothetical protein
MNKIFSKNKRYSAGLTLHYEFGQPSDDLLRFKK